MLGARRFSLRKIRDHKIAYNSVFHNKIKQFLQINTSFTNVKYKNSPILIFTSVHRKLSILESIYPSKFFLEKHMFPVQNMASQSSKFFIQKFQIFSFKAKNVLYLETSGL